ncbi:Cro/C1-type HTH DNA-binding domain-containing protein [Geodermatophilus africanus]|uniref:Cro/C1-type HTH DNA-binding domain-containing protein n=1 Tax=Geodermatophilus africanus TaxID=1137993 RepID=A0A1H3PN14_9ACTN|nr:Cro/C1-type HTH DNA-binding domain-containing protein [Geodermatophilus africanus]
MAHTTLRGWEVGRVRPQPLQLALVAGVLDLSSGEVRALAGPDRVRTARTSGGTEAAPLCRARLAAGLTMTQLARKVGVGPATISRWENGLRMPSPDARARLATALEVTNEDLAGMLAHCKSHRSDGVLLPGLGRLRADRGFTQRAFRTAVGIGASAASAWEHGRVRVPTDRLATVAAVLGLAPDTLVVLACRPPRDSTEERPLAALRRAAGVTQRELAHHVGVSRRSVVHWENGTRPLPLAAVRPMARCLRRPVPTVLAAAGLQLPTVPHPRTWTPADLPRVLHALRSSSGWAAAALGRRIGVPGRTVRAWETGVSLPSLSACQRLELVHGLPRGVLSRLAADRPGAGRTAALPHRRETPSPGRRPFESPAATSGEVASG